MNDVEKDEFNRCMTLLLAEPDAQKWAEAFCLAMRINKWSLEDIDEGLMVSWFANAMWRQEEADKTATSKAEEKWYDYWLKDPDHGVKIRK
jgi:hypothetical protein